MVSNIFLFFTPIPGEMIQFDKDFSNGVVQPPTRNSFNLQSWWYKLNTRFFSFKSWLKNRLSRYVFGRNFIEELVGGTCASILAENLSWKPSPSGKVWKVPMSQKKVVQMLFSTGEESRFGLRTRSADEIIELQNDVYTGKCRKLVH